MPTRNWKRSHKNQTSIDIGFLVNWIADRRITIDNKKRSEHADEMVYFAREIRENVNDDDYWKEMFYDK